MNETEAANEYGAGFKRSLQANKLHPMKMGSHEYLVNSALGYYPYFSVELRRRVKQKRINNMCFTGEGGVGKSYLCMDIFRTLSKNFDVEDIVFTYPEFLRAVITTKRGTPIEFDEPSYAMSKKDWFKEVTKALVKTIESFRFKGKPLGIPIINKALLEKDIRAYLLQFQIFCKNRGDAIVYRLYPSQWDTKVFSYQICRIKYGMFDYNLCKRDSCLDCKKLDPTDKQKRCMIFRARYERRKATTQDERYAEALDEAEEKEASKMSLDEIEAKVLDYFDIYYNVDKNDIDVDLLAMAVKRKLGVRLGHNKTYRLKKQIMFDHPKMFEEAPAENVNTIT